MKYSWKGHWNRNRHKSRVKAVGKLGWFMSKALTATSLPCEDEPVGTREEWLTHSELLINPFWRDLHIVCFLQKQREWGRGGEAAHGRPAPLWGASGVHLGQHRGHERFPHQAGKEPHRAGRRLTTAAAHHRQTRAPCHRQTLAAARHWQTHAARQRQTCAARLQQACTAHRYNASLWHFWFYIKKCESV